MKVPVLSIGTAISLVGLLLSVLAFLFGFTSFMGGAQFYGSFKDATAPSASPRSQSMNWYDIHREYRGVFFLNGRLAIGYLVEDTPIGIATALPPPREGVRWVSGVPSVPFATPSQADWSIPGLDSVNIRYGKPAPPDSWYARCVRVHTGLLMLATSVLPAWWIARRVQAARAKRRKGFEVSQAAT
jgi:hypothetical protein